MSTPTTDGREHYYAPDRAAWRAWLERHHATSPGVWLIYYKQASGRPRVPYTEAVEEALCYGWVDSRPHKLDDERYMQLFSPPKPKSPWSKLNKERVVRLTQHGLMTAAGLAVIDATKRDGSWDAYNEIEALQVPEDLASALSANDDARQHFEAFGASSKKQILWWIASAKHEETRRKRIVGQFGHEDGARLDTMCATDGGVSAPATLAALSTQPSAPPMLAALRFGSPRAGNELVEALEALATMNAEQRLHVPATAPVGFIPKRWAKAIVRPEGVDRHGWEARLLHEARGAPSSSCSTGTT